jgi:hypothetical protein
MVNGYSAYFGTARAIMPQNYHTSQNHVHRVYKGNMGVVNGVSSSSPFPICIYITPEIPSSFNAFDGLGCEEEGAPYEKMMFYGD